MRLSPIFIALARPDDQSGRSVLAQFPETPPPRKIASLKMGRRVDRTGRHPVDAHFPRGKSLMFVFSSTLCRHSLVVAVFAVLLTSFIAPQPAAAAPQSPPT